MQFFSQPTFRLIVEVQQKYSNLNQKTLPYVSKLALRVGVVGGTGLEPVTPGL